MNKLDRPTCDDAAALEALASTRKACSYPGLQDHVDALKAGYEQYVAANGDVRTIANVLLPDPMAGHLRKHYGSPPKALAHIKSMRTDSSSKTCSMCGSLHGGTLDHLVDKERFPAFSIFSQNLVPACLCNSKRPQALSGPNAGERILHPYFDSVLAERIVAASFTDLGSVPHVETRVVLPRTHPDFAAAAFHHDSVIMNTSIHGYLADMWVKLLQRPDALVTELRHNPATLVDLAAAIFQQRSNVDYLRSSKNNWDSIFLSGLLDPPVITWLFDQMSKVDRLPGTALI